MPHQIENFAERWNVIANPGAEHTEQAFTDFIRGCGRGRKVLNCAVPLARAHALTNFQMAAGLTAGDCITTSVTGNFPESLRDWQYQPKFCSEPQLPQLAPLPPEAATLQGLPWFESPSQSTGLGINARHVRYHHSLWQELKPKVLQGVHTTLVLALPQIGFALAPHIQLEKVFLFLGSLARGLGPVQLFPARYLYPDAALGGLANMPAPIFADILPTTGGFAYPCVDCEPDLWRVLARFGNGDRYYGYPFRAAGDSMQDFTLRDPLSSGQEWRCLAESKTDVRPAFCAHILEVVFGGDAAHQFIAVFQTRRWLLDAMENAVDPDDGRETDANVQVGGSLGNHQLQQVRHGIRHIIFDGANINGR